MKLQSSIPISSLIEGFEREDFRVIGNPYVSVCGFNDYPVVRDNEITWCESERLLNKVFKSAAACIIINERASDGIPKDKTFLITKYPLSLFDRLAEGEWLKTHQQREYVAGKNIILGEGVRIGRNVEIGDNCVIFPNVVILDNVKIGDNVVIQSNSVVGSDAFSYIRQRDGSFAKRKVWGNVIIENNVEIGAQCAIDKGVTSDTVIGEGTKLDNQVHIGHDVRIGRNCRFSAQVGIAGYAVIKDSCTLWGKSGVANRITVADGSEIMGSSVVTKDVLIENQALCGFPAENKFAFWKKRVITEDMIKEYINERGNENC